MDLSQLKVLDLGTAVAGPYAAALLADLGAQVTKVEKPKRGDSIRFADRYVRGESGYFLGVNRGKQSITVDIRKPQGQEIIRRLVREADVLIENFRPGIMDKLSLGYEALKAVNPRLVYCSIHAFPEVPGFETASGNDITIQAYAGLMDMTGYPDAPPAKMGVPAVDTATAMLSTIAILAAIARRDASGRGEHVRTSLLEGAFALMPNFVVTELNTEHKFGRLGSGHPQLVPYEAFMCADAAYLVVGALHRGMWVDLCRVLDLDDIRDDVRFAENFDRVRNRAALIPIIQARMLKQNRDDWIPLFRAADIPCSPILSIREALDFFVDRMPALGHAVQHSRVGALKMLRSPFQFEDDPITLTTQAAPQLGEHNDRVLQALGFDQDAVAELRSSGTV